MAKEEVKVSEVTAENIEELLKSGATPDESIAKEAAEKIAKERKEAVTDRLITCMKRSDYTRKCIALSMQRSNKEAKIRVNYTKAFTEKDTALREGKLAIDDYEKECEAILKTAEDAIRENGRHFDRLRNELDTQCREFRFGYNKFII